MDVARVMDSDASDASRVSGEEQIRQMVTKNFNICRGFSSPHYREAKKMRMHRINDVRKFLKMQFTAALPNALV